MADTTADTRIAPRLNFNLGHVMNLLESGLKAAQTKLATLPPDQDWAILAVREGDSVTFGGVLRVKERWQIVGEIGKSPAQDSWDWRVAIMGKLP